MLDDAIETIGRRLVAALAQLPTSGRASAPGEVVNTLTGERFMPSNDDDGFDHGVVTVISPDNSATAIPGHHYLDRQLKVAAREELGKAEESEVSRHVNEMLEHLRRDYSI